MCTTCGCGHPEQVRIGEVAHSHHDHDGTQSAVKNPNFSHFKFHSVESASEASETQKRLLKVEQDVLGKNNQIAAHNRFLFQQQHILALNLVSSPGSGKTTLLTTTLNALKNDRTCYVIEGDQQTENDVVINRASLEDGLNLFSTIVEINVQDPISGAKLKNTETEHKYSYENHTYFFENEENLELFRDNPEKYLGNLKKQGE